MHLKLDFFQDIFSTALNINPPLTSDWRREINRTIRETDLITVVKDPSVVIQAETKSGVKSYEGKAELQLKKGKTYFESNHGQDLTAFTFLPVISLPDPSGNLRPNQAANCLEYYLWDADFQAFSQNNTKVQTWFNNLKRKTNPNSPASQDQYETLVKRLTLHSALTLTTLPQQISVNSPDSHLVILRSGSSFLFMMCVQERSVEAD